MKKSGAAPGENFWVSRGNKLVESYMYNVFAFGDWRIFQQKENPQYENAGVSERSHYAPSPPSRRIIQAVL